MILSLYAVLAIVFVFGALVFVAGTIVVRANKIEASIPAVEPDAAPHWMASIGADDAPLDAAGRIELVERLAILGEPWCIEALRAAAREERDKTVLDAITKALGSRS